jgi:hypothetical protein
LGEQPERFRSDCSEIVADLVRLPPTLLDLFFPALKFIPSV